MIGVGVAPRDRFLRIALFAGDSEAMLENCNICSETALMPR